MEQHGPEVLSALLPQQQHEHRRCVERPLRRIVRLHLAPMCRRRLLSTYWAAQVLALPKAHVPPLSGHIDVHGRETRSTHAATEF